MAMEILEEFPQPIELLAHCHTTEEELAVVACGDGWVHGFNGKEKVFSHQCHSNMAPFMLHCRTQDRNLTPKVCAERLNAIEHCDISRIIIAKDNIAGVRKDKDVVVLSTKLLVDLHSNTLHNTLSDYALQEIGISEITQDGKIKVVFLKIVSLDLEYNCLHASKNLYVSMFGMKAFEKSLKVLLVFLQNGHIWCIPLGDNKNPTFLYSTECTCVDAFIREKSKLKILSTNGKITSIESQLSGIKVTEEWRLKEGTAQEIANFCSNRKSFTNCGNRLVADRNFLIFDKVENFQSYDSNLKSLLNEIDDLSSRRSALALLLDEKDVDFKERALMCGTSSERRNLFQFLFDGNHIEVKLDSGVEFKPFEVVCSGDGATHCYHSFKRVVCIPYSHVIQYKKLSCIFVNDTEVINVGNKQLNLLMFLVESEKDYPTFGEKFSFQLIFHDAFVNAVGDIKSFLFFPEITINISTNMFRLLQDFICLKMVKRNELNIVRVVCTNRAVLLEIRRIFLNKILKHYKTSTRKVAKPNTIEEEMIYM